MVIKMPNKAIFSPFKTLSALHWYLPITLSQNVLKCM